MNNYITLACAADARPPTFSVKHDRYILYVSNGYAANLYPSRTLRVPLGLSFNIPDGFFLNIASRSRDGYFVRGINLTGDVYDLHLSIRNLSNDIIPIKSGQPLADMTVLEISDLPIYVLPK